MELLHSPALCHKQSHDTVHKRVLHPTCTDSFNTFIVLFSRDFFLPVLWAQQGSVCVCVCVCVCEREREKEREREREKKERKEEREKERESEGGREKSL